MRVKPLTLLGFATAIAIAFGGGGYWLGKQRSSTPAPENKITTRAHDDVTRRVDQTPFDSTGLRLKLDAETNSLKRFNLALQSLEKWMNDNPREALDWLNSQPVSRRRGEVIRMALRQFSETDAKGAAEWALKNLSGGDLNNNLIVIANQWAAQNGQEAATWFLKLPATRERNAAVEGMFFTWASNDPAAALDFIRSNSEIGDFSPTLRRASLAGWAKSDPQAAVTASLEISQALNDPTQFANTLANWATVDLETSSQWLLGEVPASPQRTAAVRELSTIFAHQDPGAGVTWLNQLTSEEERGSAASTLVAEWSRESPSEAAKWASTLNSDSLPAEVIEEICHNFLRRDPAAFDAWRMALPSGTMKEQADQLVAPDEDP